MFAYARRKWVKDSRSDVKLCKHSLICSCNYLNVVLNVLLRLDLLGSEDGHGHGRGTVDAGHAPETGIDAPGIYLTETFNRNTQS